MSIIQTMEGSMNKCLVPTDKVGVFTVKKGTLIANALQTAIDFVREEGHDKVSYIFNSSKFTVTHDPSGDTRGYKSKRENI